MICIKQNEDYWKYLHLQYADTQEPLDLTGCSVYSQMRTKPGGTLKATATVTVTALTGDILVKYAAADTLSMQPGEYGFDVWLVDSTGKNHCIYTSRVTVEGRYTENLGGA